MRSKFLTLAFVLASFAASAKAMGDYYQFKHGRGGEIIDYIVTHDTQPVTDEQAQELFILSLNLTGGIWTIREDLLYSFPGAYDDDWQISENQQARLGELYGKLSKLSEEWNKK